MQQAVQQLQGMFQDREPEPFGSAPGSAVPSQARRVPELCAGRRDQGFVTQPGSSTSTRCGRIFARSGVIPGQATSAQGNLEMKGVAKMSPNPTSARIPQQCVGTSMVSPVPRCPLGGGCGTEGTVTRVGSSCDHVGVTRPQRRIPWDNCALQGTCRSLIRDRDTSSQLLGNPGMSLLLTSLPLWPCPASQQRQSLALVPREIRPCSFVTRAQDSAGVTTERSNISAQPLPESPKPGWIPSSSSWKCSEDINRLSGPNGEVSGISVSLVRTSGFLINI